MADSRSDLSKLSKDMRATCVPYGTSLQGHGPSQTSRETPDGTSDGTRDGMLGKTS
jgi:hypothetical protein